MDKNINFKLVSKWFQNGFKWFQSGWFQIGFKIGLYTPLKGVYTLNQI